MCASQVHLIRQHEGDTIVTARAVASRHQVTKTGMVSVGKTVKFTDLSHWRKESCSR